MSGAGRVLRPGKEILVASSAAESLRIPMAALDAFLDSLWCAPAPEHPLRDFPACTPRPRPEGVDVGR